MAPDDGRSTGSTQNLFQFMNVFNETKEEQQLQRHPGGEANRDSAPAAAELGLPPAH